MPELKEIFEKLILSPVGKLTIVSDGVCVTEVRFGDHTTGRVSCPVLERAAEELAEYFEGKRRTFSVPLAPAGTEFQRSVWDSLLTIPYGETATYSDIAGRLGKPKACRAVGSANNRNHLPVFIPCHRVVGKNGKLVGYAGGLAVKELLLKLERGNG